MPTYHESCSPWAASITEQVSGGLELLSPEELQAVMLVVRAVVGHDEDRLRALCTVDDDVDPFEPTRHWREWPQVDLVVPPGEATEWGADVIGSPDRGWTVDIRMWTVQEEGPSDLVLHLEVAGSLIGFRGLWT